MNSQKLSRLREMVASLILQANDLKCHAVLFVLDSEDDSSDFLAAGNIPDTAMAGVARAYVKAIEGGKDHSPNTEHIHIQTNLKQ